MATLVHLQVCGKITVLVVYLLILFSSREAVDNEQNQPIECIDYEWGVQCYSECPYNCTCTLTDISIISNCTDGSVFARPVLYPSGNVTNLYWNGSTLHGIQPGAFVNISNSLQILVLRGIGLQDIQLGAFAGLTGLKELWLYDNALRELEPAVFVNLTRLTYLWLGNNALQDLQPGKFAGLLNLQWLSLSSNELCQVEPGVFSGLVNLDTLLLHSNALYNIHPAVFTNLTRLEFLSLSDNLLEDIQPTWWFTGLNYLQHLWLDGNALHEIKPRTFAGLTYLKRLYLYNNVISKLEPDTFINLIHLKFLQLYNNAIQELKSSVFEGMENLLSLKLNGNSLRMISSDAFGPLQNLRQLWLSNNSLSFLYPDIFNNQTKLVELRLDQNQFNHLASDIFHTLQDLKFLNLSRNNLNQIPELTSFTNLNAISLQENPLLWIDSEVFPVFHKTVKLFVTSPATCCFASHLQCESTEHKSPYLTCMRMLNFDVLRISLWFLSILGLFGNTFGLYVKFKHRRQNNAVQFLLITNLAISDFMMGIYLLILLSADAYYVNFFPSRSEYWRHGWLCRLAGALSVLSCEASAFLIMLISIDRFLGVKYPFGGQRMGTKLARILVATQWIVAFGFSIATFVLSGMDSDLYANSEVCIGIPISRYKVYNETTVTVEVINTINTSVDPFIRHAQVLQLVGISSRVSSFFSIAMFTGLNLVCFFIVFFCYTAIFITARKTTRAAGRTQRSEEEMRMAMKMSLLVLTDFCCWVPIGILSILVQADVVEVSPVAYAWIATFVLPINSALNQFLYTLAGYLCNRESWKCFKRRKGQEENIKMNRKMKHKAISDAATKPQDQ